MHAVLRFVHTPPTRTTQRWGVLFALPANHSLIWCAQATRQTLACTWTGRAWP